MMSFVLKSKINKVFISIFASKNVIKHYEVGGIHEIIFISPVKTLTFEKIILITYPVINYTITIGHKSVISHNTFFILNLKLKIDIIYCLFVLFPG